MAARLRAAAPLLGWVVCLVVAIALLATTGRGPLAGPTLTQPGTWGAWLGERDPIVAVVSLLRLVALGLAWYLLGVTTVSVLARTLRAARLVRLADALSIPLVRRLSQQAVGVSLAGAVLTSVTGPLAVAAPTPMGPASAGAVASAAGDATLTMAPLDDAPTAGADDAETLTMAALDDPARAAGVRVAETITMQAVEAPAPPAVAPPQVAPPADAAGATDAAAPAPAGGREVTVASGDHLWSLAEDALVAAWGRDVSDDELAPYWRDVVEANRDRLADPTDPDLLFPGQQVVLPATPPAP
ncbi:MAG: LysM peptidoglycan-binding domain-containing protein [Actinomycetes bacterium]